MRHLRRLLPAIWLHTPDISDIRSWFQRDQPVVEQALLNYQRGHILAAEDGTPNCSPTPQPVVVLTPEPNRTDMPEERGSVRQYIAFSFSRDGLIGSLVLLVIVVTSGLIAAFGKNATSGLRAMYGDDREEKKLVNKAKDAKTKGKRSLEEREKTGGDQREKIFKEDDSGDAAYGQYGDSACGLNRLPGG